MDVNHLELVAKSLKTMFDNVTHDRVDIEGCNKCALLCEIKRRYKKVKSRIYYRTKHPIVVKKDLSKLTAYQRSQYYKEYAHQYYLNHKKEDSKTSRKSLVEISYDDCVVYI
jgi:hypothetical protein